MMVPSEAMERNEEYKLVEAVGRLVNAGGELGSTPDGRVFIALPDEVVELPLPTLIDITVERERIELEGELAGP